jgi:hypothetical protein
MKKITTLFSMMLLLISCGNDKDAFVLKDSIGKDNRVLIVSKSSNWLGDVGNELRTFMSKEIVGLPQPEATLTLSQVAPNGFSKMMKMSRNILMIEESGKSNFNVIHNKYAQPQTIIYVSAKDKEGILTQLAKYNDEIVNTFRSSDIKVVQKRFAKRKLDDSKYKTLEKLKVSLTIPDDYKTVDDTGEFLWLRHHLKSGIARGAGSNNILVYTLPLEKENFISENISAMRDSIGKKYIPGSKEGMHMITEKAYTPFTIDSEINGLKAFETRGKWEVKNDFMAGPFLNYTIVDKKNNRLLVFEGFTYSPSVNKRDFIFELEAIAKTLQIN